MKDAPGPGAAQTMASVLAKENKVEEAERVLQESLAVAPDSRTAIQLSLLFRSKSNGKSADNVLRSWLEKHPKDVSVRQLYGTGLMGSNRALAEQQFRQVLDVDPNNIVALNNLAWLLAERDPQQANQFAQRALKISPNFPSVQDTTGWVAWQLKQAPAAMALLERAHKSSPDDPEVGYHLSVVLAASNRQAEAKDILTGILASKKQFEDRQKAAALRSRLK